MANQYPSTAPRRGRLGFSWQGLILASMLLFTAFGGAGAGKEPKTEEPAATTQERPRQPLTSAYVFDRGRLTFSQRDAANLDQMNFSFALIKDGKVSGAHWRSIGKFQAFMEANPHILPVLSVGGWGADGFSQAASTQEGRKLFVESALELMEQYGFLGLDVDWEYPCSSAAGITSSPEDKENFTLLLRDLREGLDRLTQQDGKDRLLGIAVGGMASGTELIQSQAVGEIVDQVNLMTYDLQANSLSTHHTNLYPSGENHSTSVDTAVQAYIQAGIPREKIMVGGAFYGRVFSLASSRREGPGLYQPSKGPANKTYDYRKLQEVMARGDYTQGLDQEAQAPYLYKPGTFITYDDPDSLRAKGTYVREQGLMGLMCWEYGGDPSGELLQAMKEGLTQP